MSQLQILWQNDEYIVVDKPSGMLTIPDRFDMSVHSLLSLLRREFESIYTVHRIDRDTSGCVLFAKNADAHRHASQLFESRQVKKHYRAIVHSNPHTPHGDIDAAIAEHPTIKGKMIVHAKLGKPALTSYTLLKSYGMYSLVDFLIHTGRTHQIRVHAQHLGFPVLCDPLYGDGKPFFVSTIKKKYKLSKQEDQERPLLQRLALHAYSLELVDAHGLLIQVQSPLHKDMQAVCNQLDKIYSK